MSTEINKNENEWYLNRMSQKNCAGHQFENWSISKIVVSLSFSTETQIIRRNDTEQGTGKDVIYVQSQKRSKTNKASGIGKERVG